MTTLTHPPVNFRDVQEEGTLVPPSQTPHMWPDDRGDCLVSGAQQGALGCSPTSGPNRTTAAQVL